MWTSSFAATSWETLPLTMVSLPAGIWSRGTNVATSLLTAHMDRGQGVSVVDGRSMPAQSTGRVQDQLAARHLGQFRGLLSASTPSGTPVTL